VIRYYDPKVVSVPEMLRLFGELKAAGCNTALVVGKDLRAGDDYDAWLENLSRAIGEMRSVTDMFFLWDDPQAKDGAELRDRLAAGLVKRFPDVKFGVSIDVRFDPGSLVPKVPELNYTYFSVILGYYYGMTDWRLFPKDTTDVNSPNRTYVQGGQGFYDSGETTKIGLAIHRMRQLAFNGTEVWFTDNAHFRSPYGTTTATQMFFDFLRAILAGADSCGWFMFDVWGEHRDTFYAGELRAPDAWARYYFLAEFLIPLGSSGLLESADRINVLDGRLARLEAAIGELAWTSGRSDISAFALVAWIGAGLVGLATGLQRG